MHLVFFRIHFCILALSHLLRYQLNLFAISSLISLYPFNHFLKYFAVRSMNFIKHATRYRAFICFASSCFCRSVSFIVFCSSGRKSESSSLISFSSCLDGHKSDGSTPDALPYWAKRSRFAQRSFCHRNLEKCFKAIEYLSSRYYMLSGTISLRKIIRWYPLRREMS